MVGERAKMARSARAMLGLATVVAAALCAGSGPAQAQLACGRFTPDVLAAPEPREAGIPVGRR